jgi:hypothetical protein
MMQLPSLRDFTNKRVGTETITSFQIQNESSTCLRKMKKEKTAGTTNCQAELNFVLPN